MRIALVTENFLPKLDGVTRALALVLKHLRHTGHRAVVLQLGQRARVHAERHRWGVVMAQLMKVYEQVAAGAARRATPHDTGMTPA